LIESLTQSRCQFNKHFTFLTYYPSKVRHTVLCTNVRQFQKALAYFATVVSYARKMFVKSTTGDNDIQTFFFVSDFAAKKVRVFVIDIMVFASKA
jgi:hypothetical protein